MSLCIKHCIKPDEAAARSRKLLLHLTRSLVLRATRADLRNHNIVNSTNNCTHPFVEWHCKTAHAFQMRSR